MSDNPDMVPYDPTWPRKVTWPLLAIPPAAALVGVGLSWLWPVWFETLQRSLETPAPFLVLSAAAIYAVRSLVTHNPLYIVLGVLAAVLTCREFHFPGTHKGVYVGLAAVAVWMVLWRARLNKPFRDFRHTSWLIATIWAYAFSQIIARRAFKFIPGEAPIHRPLEELAETAAHLMFIVTALLGNWRRYGRRRD